MRLRLLYRVIVFTIVLSNAGAGNSDVIVLVHGFFGWGGGDFFGLKYWGGKHDIVESMRAAGHDVRIAAVGPISSNWDRAVELYAYIKGGCVDYGESHSAQFNHSRFGRSFPGLYPEWGTQNSDGSLRRVHLVGHSMGGNTIRVLLRLLADGDAHEREHTSTPERSSLFDGGRSSWVHSISTINTPHDGTTLIGGSFHISALIDGIIWQSFKAISSSPSQPSRYINYDFKLDHFGVQRRQNESFKSYTHRIRQSPIWDNFFRDFSAYDLSVPGAREMNAITPALPNVYYFSYGSRDTRETWLPFSKCQVPRFSMWVPFWISSSLIGCRGDEILWPNDGLINTHSQTGPKLASRDVIIPWDANRRAVPIGVWNHMGILDKIDHIQIIGIGGRSVDSFYENLAANLAALPFQTSIFMSETAGSSMDWTCLLAFLTAYAATLFSLRFRTGLQLKTARIADTLSAKLIGEQVTGLAALEHSFLPCSAMSHLT